MGKYPNLLIWVDNHVEINPDAAVLFKTQFGTPMDVFKEWCDRALKPMSETRLYHIAVAYDAAKGTNTVERLGTALKDHPEYFADVVPSGA